MAMQATKFHFLNKSVLRTIGVLAVLLLAAALLWHGNVTSYQATPALLAEVYFDGEYRIADGPWQKIVKGNHISSTQGDVMLRGNFHMVAPGGEYVGIYRGDVPIAFYTDHINLTFYEKGIEPNVIETENTIFKDAACGASWVAHTFWSAP